MILEKTVRGRKHSVLFSLGLRMSELRRGKLTMTHSKRETLGGRGRGCGRVVDVTRNSVS